MIQTFLTFFYMATREIPKVYDMECQLTHFKHSTIHKYLEEASIVNVLMLFAVVILTL